jgi:hypothetical protein
VADFIDDIVVKLVGSGISAAAIFKTSKAEIPSGAGPFLSVSETGGTASTWIQNKSTPATKRPTAQIKTRAETYKSARALAKTAHTALNGIFNTTINGTFYLKIVARQEPTDGGLDDLERPTIYFNIEAEKQPS